MNFHSVFLSCFLPLGQARDIFNNDSDLTAPAIEYQSGVVRLLSKKVINEKGKSVWERFKNSPVSDFYYFLRLNDNEYMIACFDVSGKNISASLETFMLSSFFSALKYKSESVDFSHEQILERINNLSFDQTPTSMFISAVIFFIDKKLKKLEVFNCGFTNPYLYYKAEDGKAKVRILNANFPPLGIDAKVDYSKGKIVIPINSDSKVFIYTDGLIEATNPYGHMYGDENLKNFLIKNFHLPNKELFKQLYSELDVFIDKAPLVFLFLSASPGRLAIPFFNLYS